ncbi:hypothetical protein T05_15269 [Trichinella murrelli]|uniref:Uncharacterized protein n=1 Tax=Trichinella murrelli TaxID=144512 RepID=A0A0V0UFD2_9BILA|nr:hypothetical protein T05_15908 [Trichinella murrelli]KRX34851.1 hypothetical protein T05_6450 [Trichinella murrelli]KRX49495.1 hypothetical protein T05_15269 [Trichinella murrelli]
MAFIQRKCKQTHAHTRRLSPSQRSNHGSTHFLLLTTVPLPSSSDQQVPLTLEKFSKNVKNSLQFTIKFYKVQNGKPPLGPTSIPFRSQFPLLVVDRAILLGRQVVVLLFIVFHDQHS